MVMGNVVDNTDEGAVFLNGTVAFVGFNHTKGLFIIQIVRDTFAFGVIA